MCVRRGCGGNAVPSFPIEFFPINFWDCLCRREAGAIISQTCMAFCPFHVSIAASTSGTFMRAPEDRSR